MKQEETTVTITVRMAEGMPVTMLEARRTASTETLEIRFSR